MTAPRVLIVVYSFFTHLLLRHLRIYLCLKLPLFLR